jgi:hypothetical protein
MSAHRNASIASHHRLHEERRMPQVISTALNQCVCAPVMTPSQESSQKHRIGVDVSSITAFGLCFLINFFFGNEELLKNTSRETIGYMR